MKRIAVLGSTGSIGTNTLDVIASHPDRLSLIGIAARARIDLLEQQVARYRPRIVAVAEEASARQLQSRLPRGVDVLSGINGLTQLATHPDVEVLVVGTAGPDALLPLLHAIEARKRIALASKELLVMAGELIMRRVREQGTSLVPVDSEHAALFQALSGIPKEQVAAITLTGSGGPLWSLSPSQIARVSRTEVLNHPKWQMGPKITVDSATLMNKGLEVIEARWLFDMELSRIRIVIHPQAVIHAIVELSDGTCLAQMSICDMRLPIQYALSYPDRWPTRLPRVTLTGRAALEFVEPDLERFPCLRIALEAARQGGSACVVLSAANDTAVRAYLQEQIAFTDIPHLLCDTLAPHAHVPHPTLEEILASDRWARATCQALIDARSHTAVSYASISPLASGPVR